jgi:hypothetical protein
MKKRKNVIQKFSTFLMLESNTKNINLIWKTDLKLENHITILTQLEPKAKPEYWASYFLKISKTTVSKNLPLFDESNDINSEPEFFQKSPPVNLHQARMHLSSYLQEACFWAAYRCYQRFSFLRHKYPLEELFQIANTNISQPEKLFKTLDLKHPKYNLEAYTKIALIRYIQNIIYAQDIEAKRTKFSDYGLLKDLNAKELKEALFAKGIAENKIDDYCLVWRCFDEIYYYDYHQNKDGFKLSKTQLAEITTFYNQLCDVYASRSHQLDLKVQAEVSIEVIQGILLTCIQAAREYRTKRFYSIDEYSHLSDKVPTLLDYLIQQEEWQEVKSIIEKLFLMIPESAQIMFKLWYGLNLTQTEIADVVKSRYVEIQKQYQVARYLGKHSRKLLKDFLREWQRIYPEAKIQDDKDIEKIRDAMNDCLQLLNQQMFTDYLTKIIQQKKSDSFYLLDAEKNILLIDINPELIHAFQTQIEVSMDLNKNSLDIVNRKISFFVSEHLQNH